MKIAELKGALGLEVVQGGFQDVDLTCAYTSDLLSDVMAHAASGCVLITIQAHRNTVAVASLVGSPAIVICNGRPIPDDMVSAAVEEKIAVFSTGGSQFEISGRIWEILHSR